jgi:hypothetical protein
LINWENMPLGQALDIYAAMAERTVIRPSSLPLTTVLNLKSRRTFSKEEARIAIEALMALNHFTSIPAGEKFVFVLYEGAVGSLSKAIEKSSAALIGAEANEGGAVKDVSAMTFENVPLGQFLKSYSDLTGRAILHPATLPVTTFLNLKKPQNTTKAETAALFEAVMAVNGFNTVPVGERYVFIFQQSQTEALNKTIAKFSKAISAAGPVVASASPDDVVPPLNFENVPVAQVCDFYALLAGKELQREQPIPNYLFIRCKGRSGASKAETFAVLDALLEMNGMEVLRTSENGLKLSVREK